MTLTNPHKRTIQNVATVKRLLLAKPYLSIRQACKLTKVCRRTYYEWYNKLDKIDIY
ncbi:hypothetical protein NG798_00660 [Ancylothrix sp. C2]|uniref:hypothetical protein n=1 Tax=Ancylothrix sp. D3o TaxID=2953691 RepID=UPI0021BB6DCD|nr:hypothetical protein [Ancylothrix sp. D3o]MCT7948304.1 hypothetical protein [Ancylothrix sp. D3o]